jgi:hypothetical protein
MKSASVAMAMCVHNESEFLRHNLRYHRAIGIERAYIYMDRCTDRTADIINEANDWVRAERRDSPSEAHYFRTYQNACMNDALNRARDDGIEWLLAIDADECVAVDTALWAKATGGWSIKNDATIGPSELLPSLLAKLSPAVEQAIFLTKETVPIIEFQDKPYWENPYFQQSGKLLRKMRHPQTGSLVNLEGFIGHPYGKSMVRASREVEVFNAHRWTRRQPKALGSFPEMIAIPSVDIGHVYHYVVTDPPQWQKKYASFARHHQVWPGHKPIKFPKVEWTKAATEMSPSEAADYLTKNVFVTTREAEEMVQKKSIVYDTAILRIMKAAPVDFHRVKF